MTLRKLAVALAAAAIATSAVTAPAQAADPVKLVGKGSTFVANYLDACRADFTKDTGIEVTYTATGSGTGRKEFSAGLVDFAASDVPYPAGEALPKNSFVYVPLIAGPVAISFNIPTIKTLNLSSDAVAGIFAGKITTWNDPAIAATNTVAKKVKVVDPKTKKASMKVQQVPVKLPKLPITVYYRSDKSGTSEVFTDYLNQVQGTLWNKPKSGTFSTAFPGSMPSNGTFQGASGSDGVANGVKSTIGAITYAEVSYAKERQLGLVSVQNASGKFVAPTADASAAFLSDFTPGKNGTITPNFKNADGAAYPIGTFAYGLAYTSGQDADKAAAVQKFFTYLTKNCVVRNADRLGYAGLKGGVLTLAQSKIADIA